mmetsp:Transcript_16268/g.54516  ORF Transcript_16268/g.54516 Transcript_16268/m.54516 type:complete len:207 (+) Transcript_16268:1087-1707(+)
MPGSLASQFWDSPLKLPVVEIFADPNSALPARPHRAGANSPGPNSRATHPSGSDDRRPLHVRSPSGRPAAAARSNDLQTYPGDPRGPDDVGRVQGGCVGGYRRPLPARELSLGHLRQLRLLSPQPQPVRQSHQVSLQASLPLLRPSPLLPPHRIPRHRLGPPGHQLEDLPSSPPAVAGQACERRCRDPLAEALEAEADQEKIPDGY